MTAAATPSSSPQISSLSPQVSGAPLHAAFSNALAEGSALPADIQYMPPGRHRIRASQGGKPVSVEVAVSAATASVLQSFLAAKMTAAAEGREDRPFFDFNHEDREASAWPTEFYWAGDDPQTGGVRARLDAEADDGIAGRIGDQSEHRLLRRCARRAIESHGGVRPISPAPSLPAWWCSRVVEGRSIVRSASGG